ncbi:MAG: hypothetical protein ACLU38_00720 [Dysosmobacter sp.]
MSPPMCSGSAPRPTSPPTASTGPPSGNVVDAISAMPYPDHYGASGDWLPWEHPYETMYAFGQKAA